MESLNNHFLSLKELLDFFAHVLCGFFGEGEREDLGGVDVLLFDHVCDLGCYGRGLASACACEDQLGGLGVLYGFKPEQMLKATEKMLKEEGEENPAEIMKIMIDSWKSIVDKSETPWALCDECYESIKNFKFGNQTTSRPQEPQMR
ncbi:MAG: hypothetical protein Q7J35_15280 [Candidatus Methanoperedens sp.]|nr:hypothetical protein [Candidatus Methanoperedens sp.]